MNADRVSDTKEEELVKAKHIIDQFIKSCSHDLKNPLSSIEGLLMIVSYYSNHAEVKHCLDLIGQSVNKMKDMIKTLEESTENLQRELTKDYIHADQLVAEILTECREDIETDKVAISTEIEQRHQWIADQHCNRIILKNLIRNAIQFNDPEKEIRKVNIKVAVEEDHVDVKITDNGIGIPEREMQKIFTPFHRSSAQSKGRGLGLHLVKELAKRLKASIAFHSKEKAGTCFQLSIPNNQTS